MWHRLIRKAHWVSWVYVGLLFNRRLVVCIASVGISVVLLCSNFGCHTKFSLTFFLSHHLLSKLNHLFTCTDWGIQSVVDALFHIASKIDLLEFFLDVDVRINHDHIGLLWLERLFLHCFQIRLNCLKFFLCYGCYLLGLS